MPQDGDMSVLTADYALLDVDDGRRLERFGEVILDRPAPGAEGHVAGDPRAWARADARFDRADRGDVAHEGWTTISGGPIEPWSISENGPATRAAPRPERPGRPLSGGGPEPRLDRPPGGSARPGGGTQPAILNLFGYTGASTLAGARRGAAITHVDASRPAVAWPAATPS